MNEQINLRLSPKLLKDARKRVKERGYANVQALVEEAMREKLYTPDELTQRELELISKVIDVSFKKNLFVGEKQLLETLRKSSMKRE